MKRGDVWWVEFDPSVGSEIRKTHPAVIVSNDAANRHLSRVVVVPFTSSTGRVYPGEALVLIGSQDSKAMADQIMAADKTRLKGRLYDDRLDVLLGGTLLFTLQRGRASADGRHDQVVNYHHVIHALRRKPMALMNLVYRDQLFPREAYRRAFERLREALPGRQACRIVVDLLALAHDRSCEAELAEILTADLDAGLLPDVALLHARFAPDPASLPLVTVERGSLASYESLLGAALVGEAA